MIFIPYFTLNANVYITVIIYRVFRRTFGPFT